MTEVSPQEWGNRYRAIRGTCESFTARLQALVVDLLAEASLEVIQIEARTKAIDSFTEKISRKRVKYANPLTEVTDRWAGGSGAAGPESLWSGCKTRVHPWRSAVKQEAAEVPDARHRLNPRRLRRGARQTSVHYVVALSPDRRRLAERTLFLGDGAGIEDALTLLIMADQRVAKDIYGKVYSGDWAAFAAKADAWHSRKRWQRAGATQALGTQPAVRRA